MKKKFQLKLNAFSSYNLILSNFYNLDTYVAGGFIRNILLNKPINDVDIFVDANLEDLSIPLNSLNYNGKVVEGQFGSSRWFLNNDDIYYDIVPFSNFIVCIYFLDI